MGVTEMPVRFKYQICVNANDGLAHQSLLAIRCPRVGECLCMSRRQVLTFNLRKAEQALKDFEEAL